MKKISEITKKLNSIHNLTNVDVEKILNKVVAHPDVEKIISRQNAMALIGKPLKKNLHEVVAHLPRGRVIRRTVIIEEIIGA